MYSSRNSYLTSHKLSRSRLESAPLQNANANIIWSVWPRNLVSPDLRFVRHSVAVPSREFVILYHCTSPVNGQRLQSLSSSMNCTKMYHQVTVEILFVHFHCASSRISSPDRVTFLSNSCFRISGCQCSAFCQPSASCRFQLGRLDISPNPFSFHLTVNARLPRGSGDRLAG